MLQIEHLSFDVRDDGRQAEILSDISFNVADGEMLVITGPNGGGKSTLAKLLMGINEATSGRIILNGEDITDLSINERAQAGIGFAFQQPPRFKGMTVRRLLNLAAGRTLSESECCGFLSSAGIRISAAAKGSRAALAFRNILTEKQTLPFPAVK